MHQRTRSSSTTFQSTPPRGGRLEVSNDWIVQHMPEFQSTPPRGGRRRARSNDIASRYVSIHAPARGATQFVAITIAVIVCFNPRPRAGGDYDDTVVRQRLNVFQSTPPRGGRPSLALFHSRQSVSIHAPARGATPWQRRQNHPGNVSIHAPARGATS